MLNAGLRARTVPGPATERMTLGPAYTALCAQLVACARARVLVFPQQTQPAATTGNALQIHIFDFRRGPVWAGLVSPSLSTSGARAT